MDFLNQEKKLINDLSVDHSKKKLSVKTFVNFALIVIVLGVLMDLYLFSSFKSYLTPDLVGGFVNKFGAFAPLVFMVVYIVALLIFLPSSIFTIFGGFIFGLFWGTLYVVFAATIAAGIGFLIVRLFNLEKKRLIKNKSLRRLTTLCEDQCETNGLQAFIILRFLYLPYMPLSYAAAFVKTARFRDFLTATFLTNIIGSFTFVFLGSELKNGFKALLLPFFLIGLTLLIPKIFQKFAHR